MIGNFRTPQPHIAYGKRTKADVYVTVTVYKVHTRPRGRNEKRAKGTSVPLGETHTRSTIATMVKDSVLYSQMAEIRAIHYLTHICHHSG